MTKQFKIFIFLLVSINSLPTQANAFGHGSGNGGGIVECLLSDGKTYSEAHDLFEGTQLHGYTYNYISTLAPTALDRYIRSRIVVNREQEKLYKAGQNNLYRLLTVLDEQPVPGEGLLTEDLESEIQSGSLSLPKDCVLKNAFRFIDYWKTRRDGPTLLKLSHYKRDLMILNNHEILYREARTLNGDLTSSRVRSFLAFAVSDQARNLSKEQINENAIRFWGVRIINLPKVTNIQHESGSLIFDCRTYLLAASTANLERVKEKASRESGRDFANSNHIELLITPDSEEEKSIADTKEKHFFDWINASYLWASKRAEEYQNWGNFSPLPFSFLRHDLDSQDDVITSMAYNRFLEYGDWVSSFISDPTAGDFERLNSIIDAMTTKVDQYSFCRENDQTASFKDSFSRPWDQYQKYKIISEIEAKNLVQELFLKN